MDNTTHLWYHLSISQANHQPFIRLKRVRNIQVVNILPASCRDIHLTFSWLHLFEKPSNETTYHSVPRHRSKPRQWCDCWSSPGHSFGRSGGEASRQARMHHVSSFLTRVMLIATRYPKKNTHPIQNGIMYSILYNPEFLVKDVPVNLLEMGIWGLNGRYSNI